MAGANNAQLKTAGWKARDITKARATAIGALSHAKMRKMGHTPKRFSHQAKVGGALKKAARREGAKAPKLTPAQDALLKKLGSRDKPYGADLGQEPRVAESLERRGLVKVERIGTYYWQRTRMGDNKKVKQVALLVSLTDAGRAALRSGADTTPAANGGKRTVITTAERGTNPTASQYKAFADAGLKVDVRGGDPKLSTARHLRPPRTRTSLYVERADGKPMTANDRRAAKELAWRLGLARGE